MNMPKPTDADRDRFREIVPDEPSVEVKPLFGNLGAFVNGNMFMGLFGSSIGVKLDDEDRSSLLADPNAGTFGPAERPMTGYVGLPGAWTALEAAPWVERSFRYASLLPVKQKKAVRQRKPNGR